MAMINPFIKVNAGGIPRLQAESTSISGNDVTYDFHNHRFLNYPYVGLIIFKLPAITAPGAAGNVYFTTGGQSNIQVYNHSGETVVSTNAGLVSGGIFVGWYSDGKLLILTGLV